MQALNSPLEAGVHAVLMLQYVWPDPLEVDQMAFMEHVMMYGNDGESGLYPHAPLNATGLAVRRSNVALGVKIFEAAGLAYPGERDGYTVYFASEEAGNFVSLLDSEAAAEIAEACRLAVDFVRDMGEERLPELFEDAIARDVSAMLTDRGGPLP